MTRLEQFRAEHPDCRKDNAAIIIGTCPDHLDTCPFEDRKDVPLAAGCAHCWNQDVKNE